VAFAFFQLGRILPGPFPIQPQDAQVPSRSKREFKSGQGRHQCKSLPEPPKELVSRSTPWPLLCLHALEIDSLRNRPMDAGFCWTSARVRRIRTRHPLFSAHPSTSTQTLIHEQVGCSNAYDLPHDSVGPLNRGSDHRFRSWAWLGIKQIISGLEVPRNENPRYNGKHAFTAFVHHEILALSLFVRLRSFDWSSYPKLNCCPERVFVQDSAPYSP
jgi:hypothetical protein